MNNSIEEVAGSLERTVYFGLVGEFWRKKTNLNESGQEINLDILSLWIKNQCIQRCQAKFSKRLQL